MPRRRNQGKTSSAGTSLGVAQCRRQRPQRLHHSVFVAAAICLPTASAATVISAVASDYLLE
ncbi:hypothetical protein E2C01_096731 [Portunus trituberculatus]|uniref:Uncharacterized protein n=1 Tax=Portunus trituberculatus TaxID=210409 RepID=A0A5B7JYN4_PORTR|nr:hypothetical protein [Portunus trituberculatus]